MKITIRKSDNKLVCWNGGNDKSDPLLEEHVVSNLLPEGDFKKMFYDQSTNSIIIDEDYIDPAEIQMIKNQELRQIDSDSIRPLRSILKAIQDNTSPLQADVDRLTELEICAKEKRKELCKKKQ